jgi:hypothetical protein
MDLHDRKKLGKRGMTAVEALRVETTRLERKIHNQFSSFCLRHGIDYWHSDPTKKSSIGVGLPDFLCLKNSRGIGIEFMILPNKLSAAQEQRFMLLPEHGNLFTCARKPGLAKLTGSDSLLADLLRPD